MYRTVWFWFFSASTREREGGRRVWFAYCMLMNDYLYTRPRQTISQWNANFTGILRDGERASEKEEGVREQVTDKSRKEDGSMKRGYHGKRKVDGGSINRKSALLLKSKVRNRLIFEQFSRLRHTVCDSWRVCYLCHSLSVVISLKK